jgi:putative sigma-54 modulation protein
MKIEFTGRQTEVPEPVRLLAERKLQKLAKVLRGITRVHVVLSVDKHRQGVEVTVHSPHLDLTAAEETSDFASSLTAVMNKLNRQAQRHMGKLQERKRRPLREKATTRREPVASDPPRAGAQRVIRSRRFVTKPMTVDEAVLEVERALDGFVVFRDAVTERLNVLYRRRDGNLGLIEP